MTGFLNISVTVGGGEEQSEVTSQGGLQVVAEPGESPGDFDGGDGFSGGGGFGQSSAGGDGGSAGGDGSPATDPGGQGSGVQLEDIPLTGWTLS